MKKSSQKKLGRISIDAINGPHTGTNQPDQMKNTDTPVSSTENGLSNFEQNFPDGTPGTSGPTHPNPVPEDTAAAADAPHPPM